MFDAQSRRIRAVSLEEEERRLVPPPSPPPSPQLPVGTGYHRRRTMLTIQSSGQYVGQPGNNSSTLSSSSSTPCAACKLLRRRCAQECPFSPYFSPHEPQKFACVHKIYGASNVSKMLMDVPENHRADAASSLVYEASARLRDPVYGCLGAISALQQQLEALQAELNAVRDACSMQQQVLMRKSMEHNGPRMPSETTTSTVPMAYRPHGDTSNLTAIFPHGVGHGERQSPDYAVPSPNGAGTPDVKERYWSSIS